MIQEHLHYLVMISLPGLLLGAQLNYKEIQSLGQDCFPSDTCSIPRKPLEDNLVNHTCECKPSCTRYRTCCIDAPNNSHLVGKIINGSQLSYNENCSLLFGTLYPVFAKTKCKQGWRGDSETKTSCENDVTNFADPISILPVTSAVTSITYKNYFCAICNDDAATLLFWNIRIAKYGKPVVYDENDILRHLTYDNRTDTWGLPMARSERAKRGDLYDVVDNDAFFDPVSMFFDYPPYISDKIHTCIPRVISDCHPDWEDELVKRKCYSYMGIIYGTLNTSRPYQPWKPFRNVHCAICNFSGGKSSLQCRRWGGTLNWDDGLGGQIAYRGGEHSDKPNFSFTLLLDINPIDGGRVGKVNRCNANELYDPFFKKCRITMCKKRGYRVKSGICQPV